jgi:hypothetical protein
MSNRARRRRHHATLIAPIEQAAAATLFDLQRVGCRCKPDFETVLDPDLPGVAHLLIQHDDWCPAVHDPADN